jgi:hypothetical protein
MLSDASHQVNSALSRLSDPIIFTRHECQSHGKASLSPIIGKLVPCGAMAAPFFSHWGGKLMGSMELVFGPLAYPSVRENQLHVGFL